MKTIKFKIKTPEGETKTIEITEDTYWNAKLEAEKIGEILEQTFIKTTTL